MRYVDKIAVSNKEHNISKTRNYVKYSTLQYSQFTHFFMTLQQMYVAF